MRKYLRFNILSRPIKALRKTKAIKGNENSLLFASALNKLTN